MEEQEEREALEDLKLPSKRKNHSLDFKREVLNWIYEDEEHPKTSYAAEKKFKADGYDVNKQSIHGWMKVRTAIMNESRKGMRIFGGGRTSLFQPELEERLNAIINAENQAGNRVRGWQVKEWAIEIAKEAGIEKFSASDGWLDRFLRRNGVSFRKVKNASPAKHEDVVRSAVEYMGFLQNAIESGANLDETVLMDETVIYVDESRKAAAVNLNGKEESKADFNERAAANNKVAVPIILSVTASGRKLHPVVVYSKKGVQRTEIERMGECFVFHNEVSKVDQEMMKTYVDFAFPPILKQSNPAIVWDSSRSHSGFAVREYLRVRKIKDIVVPGELAEYVQAGDLGISKCFQDNMNRLMNAWRSADESVKKNRAVRKASSLNLVCEWVEKAWSEVPDSIIQSAVKAAGFGPVEEWMLWKNESTGTFFQKCWMEGNVDSVSALPPDHSEHIIIVQSSEPF